MGTEGCQHIVDAIDLAVRERVPVVGLWHSGGARLAEGVVALDAVGQVFAAMVRASGRVPQISVVLGPAAGGAAYGPALTDIVIMSGAGRIFVTGPEVVRSVTGEQVDMERLGGPEPHGRRSGVVHVTTKDDESALGHRPQARRAARPPGPDQRRPTSASRSGPRPGRAAAGRDEPRLRREAGGHGAARRARRGAARQVGAERRHHARPVRRPHGRRHREQPAAPGRLPRLVLGREGGPLRADVRLARRAAGRARRRARLPARPRPGVGRRGAARRQAAARLRRGGRAPGDAGDPQGVRRRVHRDELPLARRHGGLRLAQRRGRRHGRERGGEHPAPQEARRRPGGGARGAARAAHRGADAGRPAASTGRWRSASSTR